MYSLFKYLVSLLLPGTVLRFRDIKKNMVCFFQSSESFGGRRKLAESGLPASGLPVAVAECPVA